MTRPYSDINSGISLADLVLVLIIRITCRK